MISRTCAVFYRRSIALPLGAVLLPVALDSPVFAEQHDPEQKRLGISRQAAMAAVVDVVAVRNLNDKDWLKRLEIEVENHSDKPIYHVQLYVLFPRAKLRRSDGVIGPIAIPLYYGRYDLMKEQNLAVSSDVPINPGQTYVFKVPEVAKKNIEGWVASGAISEKSLDSILLRVYAVSFGDGTGLRAGGHAFP